MNFVADVKFVDYYLEIVLLGSGLAGLCMAQGHHYGKRQSIYFFVSYSYWPDEGCPSRPRRGERF
jgi:hypothetical protein